MAIVNTPKELSLSDKVGQLLVLGFEGTTVTQQARTLISEYKVGALIISSKNIINAKQTQKLIYDLQKLAFESGHPYPLLICIDEEGGMLNSLSDSRFITQFPGAMALASTGSTEMIHDACQAIAQELKSIGVGMTLGPVLDVVAVMSNQLIGVRSMGSNTEQVCKYGAAAARGYKDGGLLTAGKHFPGLGTAVVDSLLGLPMVHDTLNAIESSLIIPFQHCANENVLDAIFVGGCAVPRISPDEMHACLSPIIVKQLIREKMEFGGVIISECLEMEALYRNMGIRQGVIMAFFAGCDLIMVCHDFQLQKESFQSLFEAVTNGTIDDDYFDESIARVMKLKSNLPTWDEILNSPKELKIWENHHILSKLLYQNSITLIRDHNNNLPLTKFIMGNDDTLPEDNGILILTPLVYPLYEHFDETNIENENYDDNGSTNSSEDESEDCFIGETVFQDFGKKLSEYFDDDNEINKNLLQKFSNSNEKPKYKVYHTSYTANGITSVHEQLIEKCKLVIIVTADSSRNMYQIGFTKHVSMICHSSRIMNSNGKATSTEKPLIIIAVSSPYDFLYEQSIVSTYICTYEYTKEALDCLVDVLFGKLAPKGHVPGERYLEASRSNNGDNTKNKKRRNRFHRWLVDEFEPERDLKSLIVLWNAIRNPMNSNSTSTPNSNDTNASSPDINSINDGGLIFMNQATIPFIKLFSQVLFDPKNPQTHFVVRNSSINSLYGFCLTWVDKRLKRGNILLIGVDRSRRNQSIGKSLHLRALRYLIKEQKCETITLGSSFPLLFLPNHLINIDDDYVFKRHVLKSTPVQFLKSVGWDITESSSSDDNNPSVESESISSTPLLSVPSKHHIEKQRIHSIMELDDLSSWIVPTKLVRELQVVGIMFDMCRTPERQEEILELIREHYMDTSGLYELYLEAIKQSNIDCRIIMALEPSNRDVVGCIIVFSNRSIISKFFPFIDTFQSLNQDVNISSKGSTTSSISIDVQQQHSIGGITGQLIDPSYQNLNDVFRLGLICTALRHFKKSELSKCIITGVEERQIESLKENGFKIWRNYLDSYAIREKNQLEKFM